MKGNAHTLPNNLHFLDAYRAIAAYWVLVAHCMIWGGYYYSFLPSPKMAVDLFMIISGFLMCYMLEIRKNKEPIDQKKNIFAFWIRRYFRIAPAYYVSLLLAAFISDIFLQGYKDLQSLSPETWKYVVVYNPDRIDYNQFNLFVHFTFIFGLHPTYSFSTFLPDWSLSLEMQFYFIFPMLIWFIYKYGYILITLFVSISCFCWAYYSEKHLSFFEPSFILFKLNMFLAGMIAFDICINSKSRFKNFLLYSTGLALISDFFKFSYGYDTIVLFIFYSLSIILYKYENSQKKFHLLDQVLKSAVFKIGSLLSYGAFLFHGFFISLSGIIITSNSYLFGLNPETRVWIIILFTSILSYCAAFIIYKYIEVPGIKLGKSIITKIR